jgi:hypothetical protein
MSDDKVKEQIDRHERVPEARALKAPDVQGARLSGHAEMNRVEQARTNASDGSLRKLPADWQEQNESIQLTDGDVSISRTNPLREADLAKGIRRNANGKPYAVYSAEASQAVASPGPIAKVLTDGEYQSSVKLNVQITNVPEVSKGVRPEDLLTFTSTVMDAGAKAVRPIAEHMAKPNALNDDLWNLPAAAKKGIEHLAQSPEQVNKDVHSALAGAMEHIDKPMRPEQRAEMAGQILPLFFFEGAEEPIDSNVAKQMNLEQLTEEELTGLGIKRKADKIADDVVVRETQKPAEITAEALDNPEGLAKLAKKFGINMPPKDTYVFVGDKDAVSAEAAAKRLGITSEQLRSLDEASLSAQKLERVPDYRDAFFNRYPGLIPVADRIFVHHGIPKWVLKEYPGIFTAREINDVESLRGIYRGLNDELHNTLMHNAWKKFLRDNPAATRRQVLLELEELDSKYGHLFVPTEGK